MKYDDQLVQNLSACIDLFDCDPFDVENPTLRTMISGVSVSDELVQDFRLAFLSYQYQHM